MELKDFDVTQINKDTKVVVFRVPVSLFLEQPNGHKLIDDYCKNIAEKLNNLGIKSLFIDDSTKVEPLTDELISTGQLKTI